MSVSYQYVGDDAIKVTDSAQPSAVLVFAMHDQDGNETSEWLAIKDQVADGTIVIAPADTSAAQTAAFAAAEDAERMRLVNERAQTDPAYAALAEFVLRGVNA